MKRVTITDVARLAGVSKGAVSFALNGRPGVSAATRERVLQAAADLGWVPNAAAKALSDGRSHSIGLVMNRPPGLHGIEPLIQHYLEGVQDELMAHETSLLIHVVQGHVAELATFREWAQARRVDGLVLIDLRVDDDRPQALRTLELPAVALGDPRYAKGIPSVWTDERAAADQIVGHLAALGHRRVARVGDRALLAHAAARCEAFDASCAAAGIEVLEVLPRSIRPECPEDVHAALADPRRPTAVLFESDVKAVAGLAAIRELGLSVPDALSVVAWDTTGIGELLHPPLTSLDHDGRAAGARAVRLLLDVLAGATPAPVQAPTPVLQVRGSTGPAPVLG